MSLSDIVMVHGIAQEFRGPEILLSRWLPALKDGVGLAGGDLAGREATMAFYGDLFRPKGRRGLHSRDVDVSDLNDGLEIDLLAALWREAMDVEPAGVEGATTRVRAPRWIQRAAYALCSTRFFGGCTERALVGSLKQVSKYLDDDECRSNAQRRVRERIDEATRVVVAHSLGSVVAYEVLCSIDSSSIEFVTLGSPLAIPKIIFDRLKPRPEERRGRWPGVRKWTNVADVGDLVAMTKCLSPYFDGPVDDVLVYNGATAHDVRPYLTAVETGSAVLGAFQ